MFMFFMYQSDYIVAPWYKNYFHTQYTNITRYDDLTFSISVPEAKPDMAAKVLENVAMPAHFYSELGDDYVERYQWRFQPTTGAYVINDKDIKKGTSITLTRQKNWWAKDNKFWKNRFNIDRVRLTVMRDSAKAFEAFKKGDIHILVATTVIEVGVDVPNANIMILENPERLGLAQIHQLRGRVGRGTRESFCILLVKNQLSEQVRARLDIIRSTQDGFEIAEKDLELRGAGEVLGTRQTGEMSFRIADLLRDQKWFPQVGALAKLMLQPEHREERSQLLRNWISDRQDYTDVG